MMFSFGEELRRERERRGIDLGQIAEATHIARRFLEAIESGHLAAIPGRFYRRAYIRAYAGQLGLDPVRFVAAYEFAAAGEAQEHALHANAHGGSGLAAALKWVALAIVGLGLSGAAAAVWRRAPEAVPPPGSLGPPSLAPSFQSAAAGRDRRLNLEPLPFVSFEDDELEAKASSPPLVRLRLRVDEPCWVEVSADGARVVEGILLRGFDREFRGEEICFSLGNAGGVAYWIDDRLGKPLGQLGDVRKHVCVTADKMADFVGNEPERLRER